MKITQAILIGHASILLSSCTPESSTKQELAEIKKLLIEINKKLDKKKATTTSSPRPFSRKKADKKELAKIVLPTNPSEKDVLAYLSKIELASAYQNSYSSRDPQVLMITAIGNKYLDLLLSRSSNHKIRFYVIRAAQQLASENDKAIILKHLKTNRDLVSVITRNGWVKDAKEILYNQLRYNQNYLPTEWIKAVASFKDQTTYEDLTRYLISGPNKSWTYNAIKSLPGIELEFPVKQAWLNAKSDKWSKINFAPIAVSYGHADALAIIIDSLDRNPNSGEFVREPEKYINQYTNAEGLNDEIRDWYKANKNMLKFDGSLKKFVVEP